MPFPGWRRRLVWRKRHKDPDDGGTRRTLVARRSSWDDSGVMNTPCEVRHEQGRWLAIALDQTHTFLPDGHSDAAILNKVSNRLRGDQAHGARGVGTPPILQSHEVQDVLDAELKHEVHTNVGTELRKTGSLAKGGQGNGRGGVGGKPALDLGIGTSDRHAPPAQSG